jgi:hypothetical protein
MKTFLIRLSLFFFLAIIIWVVGVWIWGSALPAKYRKNLLYTPVNGFSQSRLEDADTVKNIDVLILGSSHAYRGFDTRIFKQYGIRAFNLGTSSQTPVQTDYLIDEYIDKIKPKYVIYDVYYNMFRKDGLESSVDLIYCTRKPSIAMLEMLTKVDKIKAYNAFIYALLRKSILNKREKVGTIKTAQAQSDAYIPGGYVESSILKNADKQEGFVEANGTVVFSDENKQAFERTLAKLKKRNIPVVIMQVPTFRRRYLSVKNHDYINRYFRSFKQVPYYNFNEIMPLPDDDFLDGSHLNQKGVNAFNPVMINKLVADGVLPNKLQSN